MDWRGWKPAPGANIAPPLHFWPGPPEFNAREHNCRPAPGPIRPAWRRELLLRVNVAPPKVQP